MYQVLIADDEKIEREGIKFLLSREEGERKIFEASNGRQALAILRSEKIDLLLTDIKMPHMDGLELSKKAREENESLQIVIFSGYSDFAFAQEAIRYGVTDYVLKPVDPERFHETIKKAEEEILRRENREKREKKEKGFLEQYFLQNYIYSGKEEVAKRASEMLDLTEWDKWHCGILIESEQTFFDTSEETLSEEMRKELRRSFFYLNLNARQSLLLFGDLYCDYALIAKSIYIFLKQRHTVRFYLSVSRIFEGYQSLPQILSQLEQQMEEKFYHPEIHVFTCDDEAVRPVNEETQDSQLMQKISEDITRKDVDQLWKHFRCLSDKYRKYTQFSAMYVKFVFSNVIQELYQENQFSEERHLEKEIDRLYGCNDISQILKITEDNIREYTAFLERSMSASRDEVAVVKNYIYVHYQEDLSLETLAEKVYLSSGYLSFIFKKETGMNLNRYIRVVRMEKAKDLLCTTNMKVAQISEKVGFSNVSYFCRSFREYYGSSPESYRKGTGEDEEITGEDRIAD
ncbi:MAG: response regulator [Eubacteriales bacterium]|nr:response regulator [Eubacteriales bacterium]